LSRAARFFFFQAEDGIRDWSVTGVQTCALPILIAEAVGLRAEAHAVDHRIDGDRGVEPDRREGAKSQRSELTSRIHKSLRAALRSEERRVGKECRARRAPCH